MRKGGAVDRRNAPNGSSTARRRRAGRGMKKWILARSAEGGEGMAVGDGMWCGRIGETYKEGTGQGGQRCCRWKEIMFLGTSNGKQLPVIIIGAAHLRGAGECRWPRSNAQANRKRARKKKKGGPEYQADPAYISVSPRTMASGFSVPQRKPA